MANVSPERLKRFFVKVGDSYQVGKQVRDRCVFARHDPGQDPPFSRLDLISCRNVLIYAVRLFRSGSFPFLVTP